MPVDYYDRTNRKRSAIEMDKNTNGTTYTNGNGPAAPAPVVITATTMGERIVQLFTALGLSQREFAQLVDIPESSFSAICRNRQRLVGDRLEAVAQALGVTPYYLVNGFGTPVIEVKATRAETVRETLALQAPASGPGTSPARSWRAAEAARLVEQLPAAQQKVVLAAVRAMVDALHDGAEG